MSTSWELDEFLDQSRRETGLTDFGEPDLTAGLSELLKSLREDVRFSAFGERAFRSRIHMHLCNRLRLADDRKRLSDIATQRIDSPLFITGLPRSGTSFLLDMLAQDPANRVPRAWEIFQPSPPPVPHTYDTDERITRVDRLLAEQGFLDPELLTTHPFGARLPEECSFIVEQSFVSGNFPGFVDAPQYERWLGTKADQTVAYAFHRRFLQHLQLHHCRDRWVLKAPPHMFHLQALLNEYPDARIVVTHRDLFKVLPSITSMATALNLVFSDPATVDPIAIGRKVIQRLTHGLQHMMQTRQRLGRPEQFLDVRYADLRCQPIDSVAAIYRYFSIPFTDEAKVAMTQYVQNEGRLRHGHGRHKYSLSDYGFTAADIRRDFKDYIDQYGIEAE